MLIFDYFHCPNLIILLKHFLFHLKIHCELSLLHILFEVINFGSDMLMLLIILWKFTFKILNQSIVNHSFLFLHLLYKELSLIYNFRLKSQLGRYINFTVFRGPYCDIYLIWEFNVGMELFHFLNLISVFFDFFLCIKSKSFALNDQLILFKYFFSIYKLIDLVRTEFHIVIEFAFHVEIHSWIFL